MFDDGDLRLVVADEGAGFVLPEQKAEKTAAGGFGLFSLRERLELLGGRLHIEAVPGQGTRVTILAPSSSRGSLPGSRSPGNRPAVISAGSSP